MVRRDQRAAEFRQKGSSTISPRREQSLMASATSATGLTVGWADGRRPRHREDACILDGELELQCFALVIGVYSRSLIIIRNLQILFSVPFQSFFRDFVIKQPITLSSTMANGPILTPTVSIISVSPSQWPTESPYEDRGRAGDCAFQHLRPALLPLRRTRC